jgi:hypothetical protein
MNSELIDKIYESCFAPQVWPEVLTEVGRIGDALGASCFSLEVAISVASPRPSRVRAPKEWYEKAGLRAARSSRACSRNVTPDF